MARAAAGMGARAPSIDSSYFSLPLLLAPNLRSPSRLPRLAPSALYGASSAIARPSGLLQLGLQDPQLGLQGPGRLQLGFWGRQQQQRGVVCGVANLESWVRETNAKEPVVVYSKSWCPYCMRVKKLLGSLGYDFEVIELDESGQPGLEDALTRVSGQYTVPNVFIGGKHIGGCDDTVALHSRGQLEPLLQAAGANKN